MGRILHWNARTTEAAANAGVYLSTCGCAIVGHIVAYYGEDDAGKPVGKRNRDKSKGLRFYKALCSNTRRILVSLRWKRTA